jgi:ribosomal protein S18 acetylase RimI-like enzyme
LPADAGDIARVYITSWRDAYRGLVPDTTLDGMSLGREAANWRRTIDGGGGRVLVLVRPTVGVTGFLSYGPERAQPRRGGRAEIFTLYMQPRYQRRGGGRRLMAGAAEAMLAEGFDRVRLWVLAENMRARRFYEAIGGRSAGGRSSTVGGARLALAGYEWPELEDLEERAAGLSEIALPDPLGAVSSGG